MFLNLLVRNLPVIIKKLKAGYPIHTYQILVRVEIFMGIDIAYGECGWNFYCVPEELNTKKGVHYLPVNLSLAELKKM